MSHWIQLGCVLLLGLVAGYKYPRDLEIESTQPVVFSYEITEEAAMLLARKHNDELKGCNP